MATVTVDTSYTWHNYSLGFLITEEALEEAGCSWGVPQFDTAHVPRETAKKPPISFAERLKSRCV